MTEDLAEHRKFKERLGFMGVRIIKNRQSLDGLYALRKALWIDLDKRGVPRATIAKWSNVDPVLVSKALGAKGESER